MKQKLGIIGLLLLLAGVAGFFVSFRVAEDQGVNPFRWNTYRNNEFGFELKYPPDWQVQAGVHVTVPMINIYRADERETPPFTHHSSVTHVSIYPHGIPTEGVFAPSVPTEATVGEKLEQGIDFILEDGTRWATMLYFTEDPLSWEPWGFVWASVKIENHRTICLRNGTQIDERLCDPLGGGDRIIQQGTIDTRDREIEKKMLETLVIYQ